MATIRVLVTVSDTRDVVQSAAMGLSAPATVASMPAGFALDPSFAAVPLQTPAVIQTLQTMASGGRTPGSLNNLGADAYVVRGYIDGGQLSKAVEAARLSGAWPRIFADPEIASFATCIGDPPLGTALDVKRLLGAGRLIRSNMDGRNVGMAIVDSGINLPYLQLKGLAPSLDTHASWTSNPALVPGQGVVGHGTMCAYDALIAAPNCLLLDCAVLNGGPAGGSGMSGTLSNALSAYGRLLQMMSLPPDERHIHSLVVSNSWGMFEESWDFPVGHTGRYSDNLNHPFNRIVGSLAAAGADILFAAGNCGPICPDKRCAGKHPKIFLANSHQR